MSTMLCYSFVACAAGDSGKSQKASGSETVKEAGSKVASAVTDAGECFLSNHPCFARDFVTCRNKACMVPCCLLHYSRSALSLWVTCVSMLAAGDSIAKSDNAPGNGAAKNGASEGAQAASKPGEYPSRT